MIADADRLKSKLRGAVVVDIDAARRARDENKSAAKPAVTDEFKFGAGVLLLLILLSLVVRR